ncbi:ceramide kinase isoform X2 [Electrophorus electricus]|uniref:DAGKc domain-containing protein n=1 Tax=Electrophorus electricus TaxID=8005 RepID=A0A4W4G3S8_ELEEL|nr:ceramide kinase isoform X2 [Electrophorus electricus]
METQPRALCSQLTSQHGLCDVTLTGAFLSWKEAETCRRRAAGHAYDPRKAGAFKKGGRCVPLCEIVAVQETEGEDPGADTGERRSAPRSPAECNQHAFTVSYVERGRKHRWQCSEVTFRCTESRLCLQWLQAIKEQLALLTTRPKRLLVYINPYGGKQRGKRIYEQKVAPIFCRASISTDVIVTERANHARDHLKTEADLQKYDGIVCVGGDGMFSEVMHGLISRTQRDTGADQNCSGETLVECSLRVGIIPAGSTDCVCYATVGSNDPVTSALHIVVGDSQPMDVCSIRADDTFLRYSVSLLGYGFYGDMLTDSERKRWMGPARYDLSGVKTFLSHRYYEGTVSFLLADSNVGTPRDKLQCRSGCNICQQPSADKRLCGKEDRALDGEAKGAWQVIRGKFLAINAACMSCACPRSPKGLSPSAHLANGTVDLILVHKCSRLDFFRHLLRHTNKDDQFDHPFVEVYRVRQFRFTPRCQETASELELELREGDGVGRARFFSQICRKHPACGCMPTHSCWNCDGEILPHAGIEVRVHCQLIKLFARGIEEQTVFDDPYTLCAI